MWIQQGIHDSGISMCEEGDNSTDLYPRYPTLKIKKLGDLI